MLSNQQKKLVKMAQREAAISDTDYRHALCEELGFGVSSSTDPGLTDRHFDRIMAYFEAIFWRKVDQQELSHSPKNTVFQRRSYWQRKNSDRETSRDRFSNAALSLELERLEAELHQHGLGNGYFFAIQSKIGGRNWKYKAALERTLKSKQKPARDLQPF
ncbi:MAG: hypothetical protein SFY81_04790 [Verrucomicrobiota bacterium]|nr:hypothetical protein [Verrucomicrobiota bacterium]